MVLGNTTMIKSLLAFFAIFASSSVAAIPNLGEEAVCTISLGDSVYHTQISPPCTWAVDSNGSLQEVAIDGKKIAIVVGQPISHSQAEKWGVNESQHCSFESVGVIVSDIESSNIVSKPIMNALVCPSILIDEVFFKSYSWER